MMWSHQRRSYQRQRSLRRAVTSPRRRARGDRSSERGDAQNAVLRRTPQRAARDERPRRRARRCPPDDSLDSGCHCPQIDRHGHRGGGRVMGAGRSGQRAAWSWPASLSVELVPAPLIGSPSGSKQRSCGHARHVDCACSDRRTADRRAGEDLMTKRTWMTDRSVQRGRRRGRRAARRLRVVEC